MPSKPTKPISRRQPAPTIKPDVREPMSEDVAFLLSRQVAVRLATTPGYSTISAREADALFQAVPSLRALAVRADAQTI